MIYDILRLCPNWYIMLLHCICCTLRSIGMVCLGSVFHVGDITPEGEREGKRWEGGRASKQ